MWLNRGLSSRWQPERASPYIDEMGCLPSIALVCVQFMYRASHKAWGTTWCQVPELLQGSVEAHGHLCVHQWWTTTAQGADHEGMTCPVARPDVMEDPRQRCQTIIACVNQEPVLTEHHGHFPTRTTLVPPLSVLRLFLLLKPGRKKFNMSLMYFNGNI